MPTTAADRCDFCGARPATRGAHHRRSCLLFLGSRRIPGSTPSNWRPDPAHDVCDPLEGADAPDALESRVQHLERVGRLLAELVADA